MPRAGSHRSAQAARSRPRSVRKHKEYKVILEAVTEKKRKLHSVLTFQDQAPRGFGFIPVGFGEFTEWCKEQCRLRRKEVHIVSAAPKNGNSNRADPEKISSHVHRIGHHFPLDIIEPACNKFGYRFSANNGLEKIDSPAQPETQMQTQKYGVAYFERRFAAYYKEQQKNGYSNEVETKDYISGAIRELFPKIPQADLASIVNHAFKEGTDRVGNASELSLARRVQLAVVAHIRHTYTDYDDILKKESWIEARQKAELPSLAKLKEWRDEDGEDSNETEETFREIIVLDDDDNNSHRDSTPRDSDVEERELSMEIVSSRATARDLQPEPVRHQPHARYVSRVPRRTIFLARPAAHPAARPSYVGVSPVTYVAPKSSLAGPRSDRQEPPRLRPEPMHHAHGRPTDSNMREPARAPRPAEVRGSDGRVYILQPIEEPQFYAREHAQDQSRLLAAEGNYYSRPVSVPSLKRPATVNDSPRPSVSRRTSEQDMVLPSIEPEDNRPSQVPRHYGHDRNRGSVGYIRNAGPYSGHEHYQEDVPRHYVPEYMDEHRHHRTPPRGDVIDLTHSPTRPFNGTPGKSLRAPSGPSNHYVLAPSYTSPLDVRDTYYDHPSRMPRAPVLDDRLYRGRHFPAPGRSAFAGASRSQPDRARYVGGEVEYGAHVRR